MADMAPRAEITSADVDRVDAVDEPATGLPFIMLKTQGDPDAADPANIPGALAKADGDASAGDAAIDREDPAAEADPGSAPWEAVDAANARAVVDGLLSVRSLISLLADRELAEGDDEGTLWGLTDACAAVEGAIGILATFAVTEQDAADMAAAEAEAQARALGLIKTLNLTAPDKEPEMAAHPTKGDLLKALDTKLAKAQEEDLPTGVIDLLNQIVAVMNAIDQVSTITDAAAQSPVDTGDGDELGTPAAPAQPDASSPVEDAMTPDESDENLPDGATDAPDGSADVEGTKDPTVAPVDGTIEDDLIENAASNGNAGTSSDPVDGGTEPGEAGRPFAKSLEEQQADMLARLKADKDAVYLRAAKELNHAANPVVHKSLEDRIADAVAAAVAPLTKRIHELEETPMTTGVLFAGHTPGAVGQNYGQGEGPTARADLLKSAAASGDLGKQTDALADAIAAIHRGPRTA